MFGRSMPIRTILGAMVVLSGCTSTIAPPDDAVDPGSLMVTDQDGDGFHPPDDCNDYDYSINPGATEIFDGIDNNCDGYPDASYVCPGTGSYDTIAAAVADVGAGITLALCPRTWREDITIITFVSALHGKAARA